MTSFAKHIAVLLAAFISASAWAEKSSDDKSSKPDAKATGEKKSKKKGSKGSEDPNASRKMDIPVLPGHPAIGLMVPYLDTNGKRQMNFKIGVATKLDDNHLDLKDLQVETFNDNGEHEMQIDLPTAVLDTETSVITSKNHVTIERHDFKLTGEAMIFHTKTKQGALGGGVHMTIYDSDEVSGAPTPAEAKDTANTPASPDKPHTPEPKAK